MNNKTIGFLCHSFHLHSMIKLGGILTAIFK